MQVVTDLDVLCIMVLFSAKAEASGKKAKAGTFSPKAESKGLISISTLVLRTLVYWWHTSDAVIFLLSMKILMLCCEIDCLYIGYVISKERLFFT